MGDRSGFVFNVNSIHLYSNNFSFQIIVAAVVFSLYTDATEIGRITDWNNNPLSHGKRMDQEKRGDGQKTWDIQKFCNTVCGKDCVVTYNSNDGDWCHECEGDDGSQEVNSCTNHPMDGTCGHDENGDECCFAGKTICGKDCVWTYNTYNDDGEWCAECEGDNGSQVSSCTNRVEDGTCGYDDAGRYCCYNHGTECETPLPTKTMAPWPTKTTAPYNLRLEED